MPECSALILSGGGLRSLVATASIHADARPGKIGLLHFDDGHPGHARRAEHVRLQARWFGITQVHMVSLVHDITHFSPSDDMDGWHGPVVLRRPRIVMSGLAIAASLRAKQLVWPCQFDGEHEQVGAITEQTVLLEHLGQIEPEHAGPDNTARVPTIDMPLLELTDLQLLEIGAKLEVPFELAWSCQFKGEKHCQVCDGCRRRHKAFEDAGLADPVQLSTVGAVSP